MKATFRDRDENGIFGFEALPLFILVFVVGVLVFAESWAAIDAKIAATSGAREAGRTFVESPAGLDTGTAFAIASDAAVSAVANHGRTGATSVEPVGVLSLERCTRVTFLVTTETRFLALPFVRDSGFTRTVSASHTEIVDPFRDGLEGPLSCVG
ncbi:MAG: hypothetical protein ACI8Y4_001239 [Candidatus Poriferisodalaceae bacterium]|jgi:hypothetical protein